MTRRCTVCEQDRQVPDEIRPKGLKCAECRARLRKEYMAGYLERTRERRSAYYRDYYEANREQVRENQRQWYLQHREERIQRSREWTRAHPDRRRQYQANWYADLKADPERYARYLEDKRMANRLRYERAGQPRRPVSREVYLRRYGMDVGQSAKLPVEPLAQRIRRDRWLLDDATVSPREIYRLLYESRHVTVSLADRVCMALNLPLTMVYPEATA